MTDVNKLAAGILVKAGYATEYTNDSIWEGPALVFTQEIRGEELTMERREKVDPFADTLQARRQLDVLEKYFVLDTISPARGIFTAESVITGCGAVDADPREARIACIKLCLEQEAENEQKRAG